MTFADSRIDLHISATPIFDLQKLAVAQLSLDGFLFADAFYATDGKLTFDGLRGGDKETADMKGLIDGYLAKEKRPIAPAGLADLQKLKMSPWQVALQDIRTDFAASAAPLTKQTRSRPGFFQYDDASAKAKIFFQGICIYQGKKPSQDEVPTAFVELLKKKLQAAGIEGFELAVDAIERKPNPVIEMQKKAIDAGYDGVVFSHVAFDAKGACYIKLPSCPRGSRRTSASCSTTRPSSIRTWGRSGSGNRRFDSRNLTRSPNPKLEIRNPKSETKPMQNAKHPKRTIKFPPVFFGFLVLSFEFVLDFEIRISDFIS